MAFLLSPSILSADFGNLQEQIEIINNSEADLIHIDVMDGVFVPNISFGFVVLDCVIKYAKKPLDIHLMITEPDKYVERFAAYKPAFLTVHFESCPHLHRTINHIKSFGVKAGVALNPHSPVILLDEIITETDLVLVMSVNPGYGGQKFIGSAIKKINQVKTIINENKSNALIEIDGGIGLDNIKKVLIAGADIVVAGNAVFKNGTISEAISELKNVSF